MSDPTRARILRKGVVALAALALASATACGPTDPMEEIRLLQDEAGDHAAAIEPLRELLDAGSDDPELHLRYGLALIALGNRSQAVWSLKKASESPEWLDRAGLVLAQVYQSIGNYDDAIDTCDYILEQKPDFVPALLVRANARIGSRRYWEEALEDAERVLELDPDNRPALVPRVLALLHFRRVEEAAVALEELEAGFRDDELGLHGSPGLCAARATFVHEKGELALAEQRFEVCLERDPNDMQVVRPALDFFDSVGRPERAQEILESLLDRDPAAHMVRSELVRRLAAQGEREAAEEVVRAATELPNPSDAAQGWGTLALLELEKGHLEAAADAFERAQELDPTPSPELLFGYADALAVAGRYEQAIAVAEQIRQPAFLELVRGRVALERGLPALALKHLGEGVRLWPNNAVARYYSAIAAERVGDFPRAVEEYRYAMRIDVRATDAYLRLARLQAEAGATPQAVSTLEFNPGGRPRELHAMRLLVRLQSERGDPPSPLAMQFFAFEGRRAAGLAALAEGVQERMGPAAAVEILRGQELAFGDPTHVAALEALVEALAADGRAGEALTPVDAGLAQQPEFAAFHALRGRALQLRGDSDAEARVAYGRALELDAQQALALRRLADLEAAGGESQAALALYERAAEADEDDRRSARRAAELLVVLGRSREAEDRLEMLLREHPYDAKAAMALAELELARGAETGRTRELARRAVHFRGGAEAEALLERVSEKPQVDPKDEPTAGG